MQLKSLVGLGDRLLFEMTGVQLSLPDYNSMRESHGLSSSAALQMDSFKQSACWSGCHSNYWQGRSRRTTGKTDPDDTPTDLQQTAGD